MKPLSFENVGYGSTNSIAGSIKDRRDSDRSSSLLRLAGVAAGALIGVGSACVTAGVHRQLANSMTQVQSLNGEIATAKACLKLDPQLSANHKGHHGKSLKNKAEAQDPRVTMV